MNIINTNMLTSNQYHDAKSLINLCRQADNSRGVAFLEPEMNYIKEYPCFFLMYNGGTLVSFASVFIPEEGVCEIYANTLPASRGKGYFKRLYELIIEKNKDFGIKKAYIVNDPSCISGTNMLQSMGAKLESSDYLMRYNNNIKPEPKGLFELVEDNDAKSRRYRAIMDGVEIGHCYVEHSRDTASIFGFWIEEAFRGNGYGTEMLLLLLNHLLEHGSKKILLHVNNANKAAHKMYFHHGFIHDEQIDYWRI